MPNYQHLISEIGTVLEKGRKKSYFAINSILVETYWEIGKNIVEYEQKGKKKADYGLALLDQLSRDLKMHYGKGFCRRNLLDMRRFYLTYPIRQTLSAKLSWSHYIELLTIEEDLERSFYEKQCILEGWSFRELKRQIDSGLFQRLALSKNRNKILELSQKGQIIEKPADLIKDPYILEFLKIPEYHSEKELEQKIIDNLNTFLLEFGKGFTFVARQFRITLGNKHFYVDLVFYNRLLRCFVLIDLKVCEVSHHDIGQMNLYLNYFKKEEMQPDDNEPIGLVLGTKNEKVIIEYALGGISNNLFVSKYKIYLPPKKELEGELKKILKNEVKP